MYNNPAPLGGATVQFKLSILKVTEENAESFCFRNSHNHCVHLTVHLYVANVVK